MRKLFAFFALLACSVANAGVVTVNFTASNFYQWPPFAGTATNPSVVTGEIKYASASLSSPIDSLLEINLAIAGHSYSLGELGSTRTGFFNSVGGLPSGITGIGSGKDDFLFDFYSESNSVFQFIFSSVGDPMLWRAGTVNLNASFSELTNQVPEPSSLALIALGLTG